MISITRRVADFEAAVVRLDKEIPDTAAFHGPSSPLGRRASLRLARSQPTPRQRLRGEPRLRCRLSSTPHPSCCSPGASPDHEFRDSSKLLPRSPKNVFTSRVARGKGRGAKMTLAAASTCSTSSALVKGMALPFQSCALARSARAIEPMSVGKLRPYAQNARTHSKNQIKQLFRTFH